MSKETFKMWSIKNQNGYISPSTLRHKRSEAIQHWIAGSSKPWRYWHRKYNHCAVRVEVTISETI